MAVFLKSPSGLDGAWGKNKLGFMLERKVPADLWTLVARLDANTTAYSDYTLAPLTDEKKKNKKVIVLYRVKAYNSLTESEFSNTKPIK